MILSKSDYRKYLHADQKALRREKFSTKKYIKEIFFPDYIWRFQKLLRKTEYAKNCKTTFFGNLRYIWLQYCFSKLSLKLGFTIPLNVFGPGLAIVHYGTIIVNPNAKIGANCRIHPSTCIGASGGTSMAPQIGDNVYIAPGVKIYGDIKLGNNITTAANAAINRSFEEDDILIGGVPAVMIKRTNISSIIKQNI